MSNNAILLEARNLKKYFPIEGGFFKRKHEGMVKAVDGVSFTLHKGETLGLIGESGCGKSTLAKVIMGLIKTTEGEILLNGKLVERENMSDFRKKVQMIFQDPYSSLDPRMNIERIIEEPLRVHTRLTCEEKRDVLLPILEKIGIKKDDLKKYPHEFSGGQRQRIGIARALVLDLDLIICDEPLSALDVSIQSSILNLFRKIQNDMGISYLFISHDMSVIKHISDRIAVMYLGRVVELADKKELFVNTLHPYSVGLMSAIPIPDPLVKRKRILLSGDPPSPINTLPGCPFQSRCSNAMPICKEKVPKLQEIEKNHFVACNLYDSGGGI